MKRTVLLLLLLASVMPCLFSQQTYLEVYGSVQTDINRSYEIVQLNDTTFVLGGEWNGTGYLMKVNHKGALIDYFFLDGVIPGNSAVKDLTLDINNNIIATGECDHCVQGDTLKKVFTIATEPSLLLITKKIHEGTTPANNLLYTPAIARKGAQFVVAASVGGPGLNFEDMTLISMTANLDTTWRKTYNSCNNCGFDYVTDIVPTAAGYAVLVLNAYTDSLTLYHVNDSGSLIWKKRHKWVSGASWFKLAYRAGVIYACGSEPVAGANPAHTGGFIRRFSENDGSQLGNLSLDIPGMNDEAIGLRFTNDGTLLAIHRRAEPNAFGSYQVSRIYRVNAAANIVIDFTEIPNPDVLTNMGATGVVSLKDNGSEFAVCGIRGFYNRSFFYSKNSVEPTAPGVVFDVSPDTACAPAHIILTNNIAGGVSYSWFLDGTLFSTEKNPAPVAVNGAGLHEIKLTALTGSQNKISNFTVLSLPEIWNECAFCDNKPDPYVVIKNAAGVVLYTSGWVESYPPVSLPVSFTMTIGQNYKLEVWDDDNVGADDFFGSFDVPGNSAGGTFSLIHPDDPSNPLTISFTTTPQTQSQTHTQMVLIYQPAASLQNGAVLKANPGNPAPAFFTWQWYLNGEPVPGATADTLVPVLGGSYAVAMVTPDCSALSNLVQFSPALTGAQIVPAQPRCFGETNGSLLVNPVGGTPPYAYAWSPANLSGNNPDGLAAGTYNVTVTDANGQTATASATLTEPEILTTAATAAGPACAGSNDGSILITPAGGTGPYIYEWNLPALTGNNPVNLAPGGYSVTVTDANGCTATATAMLTEPEQLTTASSVENPACANGNDGSVLLEPNGGTEPYTYTWDSPLLSGNHLTGLTEGNYAVTITDANGCTVTATASLDSPPAINATTTSTPQAANTTMLGTATVTPEGGTPPYTYLWSDPQGQTTQTATGLTTGNYAVTVTDANGCSHTTSVFVDFINASDEPALPGLKIYPNPSSGIVFIEMEQPLKGEVVIEIFDPTGSVLRREKAGKLPPAVDFSAYADGVYLLSLTVEAGKVVRKIVLQR